MKLKVKILFLVIFGTFGGASMAMLFTISENITHYHNRFIRRFPQHVAQEVHQTDLKYNSYYFAGSGEGKIYLGNYTAPLQVMVLDSALQTKTIYHIKLDQSNLPFRGPQIRVLDNSFYVFEGIVPYVFKGDITDWSASLRIKNGNAFSHLIPMDSLNMAVRYISPKGGESIIGTLNLGGSTKAKYGSSLLQKQFDGVFDTDGSMMFNTTLNRIVYVYTYRNEYIVADPKLKLDYRGKTIDTTSHAHIKLARIKNTNLKTFAEPPLIVNKTSAVNGRFLYVNSQLPGQYESEGIWKTAAIIDVYDLTTKTYRSSFPIYNIGGTKLRSILVDRKLFYALIGEKIVCYKLQDYINQNRTVSYVSKYKSD
jgi:hypothetical protein